MKTKAVIHNGFTPQLIDEWNAVLAGTGRTHDLGQTPEWCARWAENYPEAWQRLFIIQRPESIYPLMIRKQAGLRVLVWVGQRGGIMSDYSGGTGSYKNLLDALVEAEEWDVADLQLPHWQKDAALLVKALRRHEKYLWRVDVSDQSIVIELPDTFDAWLVTLARTPRNHARKYVRKVDKGLARFEILTGADVLPALDGLIANNQKRWQVFRRKKDADFLTQTVADLEHNGHLFLARLGADSNCWAACMGYVCGESVFLHTAGIRCEMIAGICPGIAMFTLLIREMIRRGIKLFDFCPGLEEYKFRLGGRWMPGHRVLFARNRRAYCQYRCAEFVSCFIRSCRDLVGRVLARQQRS